MINSVIILPLGSTEYHGELLPASTDTIIAERVAKDVANKIKNSVVLPVLPYGLSTEHADFPQTVSIPAQSYLKLILDILESISREKTLILLINGHGGNSNILSVVESEYNYAHSCSKVFIPKLYSKSIQKKSEQLLGEYDTHAGSVESSLVASYSNLKPLSIQNSQYVKQMSGSLRFFKTKEVNPLGVIKDTENLIVSPSIGKILHREIVSTIVGDTNELIGTLNRIIGSEK